MEGMGGMERFTRSFYLVFGVLVLVAAVGALVRPGLILGDELSGLTAHLVREQAAGFVFIGLMALWCRRHYEARRPVHLGLVAFTAIFAGIHWIGAFQGHWNLPSLAVNTIPAALFVVTAPWKER